MAIYIEEIFWLDLFRLIFLLQLFFSKYANNRGIFPQKRAAFFKQYGHEWVNYTRIRNTDFVTSRKSDFLQNSVYSIGSLMFLVLNTFVVICG